MLPLMAASRLLLDTQVFLWWRSDSRSLRAAARRAIAVADVVFVSAATAWEAAIKITLGRLRIPDTIEAGVVGSSFEKLVPIAFLVAHRDAFTGREPAPGTGTLAAAPSGHG